MSGKLPGKGLFGWLGRQFGYITKAVKTDIGAKTVYRQEQVQETELPQDPGVRLRRTTIDEVIVKAKKGETGRES